jgi:hypothetical protein
MATGALRHSVHRITARRRRETRRQADGVDDSGNGGLSVLVAQRRPVAVYRFPVAEFGGVREDGTVAVSRKRWLKIEKRTNSSTLRAD